MWCNEFSMCWCWGKQHLRVSAPQHFASSRRVIGGVPRGHGKASSYKENVTCPLDSSTSAENNYLRANKRPKKLRWFLALSLTIFPVFTLKLHVLLIRVLCCACRSKKRLQPQNSASGGHGGHIQLQLPVRLQTQPNLRLRDLCWSDGKFR